MRFLIIMLGLFYPLISACQFKTTNTVKFKFQIERNNPLIGAKILIKNSNPLIGTTTDMNGEAELIVKSENTINVVDPVGPYIEFKLSQPVDSVFLNVRAKKVVFYYKNKKVEKIKLNIATPF